MLCQVARDVFDKGVDVCNAVRGEMMLMTDDVATISEYQIRLLILEKYMRQNFVLLVGQFGQCWVEADEVH